MIRLLSLVLLLQVYSLSSAAQTKTILISESGLPYTEQTWFAYGDGSIEEGDITSNWSHGKRIVSAAYTADGWLVIMAKNTGYTMQTYTLSKDWPEQWIESKIRENYMITSMSRGQDEWLIVMSQGSGLTSQQVWHNDWATLAPWMTEQKAKGYFVTGLAYDGHAWTAVMSQGSKYISQGYFWVDNTKDLMSRVQNDVWGRGFNLHQVAYGESNYVVVFGNYVENDNRYQNLQISPQILKDYIRQQWEKSICIVYVGGGLPGNQKKAAKKSWFSR